MDDIEGWVYEAKNYRPSVLAGGVRMIAHFPGMQPFSPPMVFEVPINFEQIYWRPNGIFNTPRDEWFEWDWNDVIWNVRGPQIMCDMAQPMDIAVTLRQMEIL